MSAVITKAYAPPDIGMGEILRYMGASGDLPQLVPVIDGCLAELSERLACKVCYTELSIIKEGDILDLGFVKVTSRALAKNLENCDRILLFAATVGIGIDRLIARWSDISPTKALIYQAIGAERIEALCDRFCHEMESEYGALRPRFSPGYGDLPLELQRDIFAYLDCPKRIGLTLNESLLMSPTKSVTAIVGILSDRRTKK